MPGDPAHAALEENLHTLGDFRVRGVLGEGGSGTVYDAEWGDRSVALKVLREELVPTPRECEQFLAEARLLRAVDHPSVVKVLGAGTLPSGRPYVVMERLAGESLARRLDRGALPLAEAMTCFEQVASAVAALHERGLIHRDIKPENIILSDRCAVLLDFGIARPQYALPSTLSLEGTLRGTPAYMAPERFFGTPASVATDVYELAVVLYMLTTGRLPWTDPTDPTSRLNLPRPSAIGCRLPAAFETELLRGLSTRAEARPASVVELVRRMRTALADAGADPVADGLRQTAELTPDSRSHVEAAPTSSTTRVTPRRGQQVLVGVAVLLLLGLGIGGAVLAGPVGSRAAQPISRTALAMMQAGLPAPAPAPVEVAPAPIAVPVPVPAPPAPAIPRTELSAVVRELLALHPSTTAILVSGSPTQLHASEFIKSALAAPEAVALIDRLGPLSARCRGDLLTGVEAFAVGLAVDSDSSIDLSARGEFSRDTVETCLADLVKVGLHEVKTTRQGDITSLANGSDTLWLGWPDARTVIASLRPAIDLEWMQARVAGKDNLRDKTALMALIDRVDTGATLWVVAAPDGPGAPLLPGTDPPLGMYVSLWLTDTVKLHAGLRYASAADAEKNVQPLQTELATLKQNPFGMLLLKDAGFAVAGDDVIFTLKMDQTTSMLTQQALFAMAN